MAIDDERAGGRSAGHMVQYGTGSRTVDVVREAVQYSSKGGFIWLKLEGGLTL